jgi:hypothetical protein
MAQVCASHPKDGGAIALGLATFKVAMSSGDTSLLSTIATTVTGAVSDIESAAVGATSTNLPAMRMLLRYLQDLASAFNQPPADPTAVVGDQDVTAIDTAASLVGCKI